MARWESESSWTGKRRLREVVGTWMTAVVLVGFVACGSPTAPGEPSEIIEVTAKVAQTAAAITGQDAPMADAAQQGKHLGFDTYMYPGDVTMRVWRTKYRWVGFYLPAPCHTDDSWSGKRDTLRAMDWGLAVVYVGQQTWGRTPRNLSRAGLEALRRTETCNADLLGAEQGMLEGSDAITRTAAEGFPRGTVVFLDVERMERIPAAMKDYYRAWTARLLADGTYRPGVYVHAHNAQEVYDDVVALYRAAGLDEEPRFWVAGGKGFAEGRAPQDVGYAFAGMWQGVIDVARSVANVRLPIDINVGAWESPSETGVVVD